MSAPATTEQRRPLSGAAWALALIPLLLLGVVLSYLVATGGGLTELAGPPVEQITFQRVTLPEPGVIRVEVINDGPQEVTIPQVRVDDAYFMFDAQPSTTIPRLGRAVFTIYYPWVAEETHVISLITSLGLTFDHEIAAAVESPQPSADLFWRFGLVGLYVGIVPIFLGVLWFPFMRRLSGRAMNFILALTVGLLMYLALGTWLDANEFAAELPAFWQGVPLIFFVAMLTLGVLLAIGSRRKGQESTPIGIAYRIALGIGLHNLGEGLAIGASFALGEAALGTFLILGFTLHNITEGVGIAAPIVRQKQIPLYHFVLLVLLAGGPAILGTWFGGFSFDPVLATVFLAIGVGAILQVVWEVGRLIVRDSIKMGLPVVNWVNLIGVVVGIALMYVTAFLVKF
ncbi:MAG: metal transporter [Anaerolineae bacterium]|nr:metal transporter [Anaerolineae bacterium]